MRINNKKENTKDSLDIVLPPWIAFPDIDPMDMYWRMGQGEEYLGKFF